MHLYQPHFLCNSQIMTPSFSSNDPFCRRPLSRPIHSEPTPRRYTLHGWKAYSRLRGSGA